MTDSQIPSDIAAIPAVERLRYVLSLLPTRGRDLADADIQATFAPDRFSLAQRRERLLALGELLDGFVLRDVHLPAEAHEGEARRPYASATLERAHEMWRLSVQVENRPPHRIVGIADNQITPGLATREATDADAAQLRQIELRAPIVSGDVRVVYDRGEDYFATERLMGDTCTIIVEKDTVPVGLNSVVVHPIAVNGTVLLGSYGYRLRILPQARGGGRRVNRLLGSATFEAQGWRADTVYAFVAAGNDAVLSNDPRIYAWSVRPERTVIDTGKRAGAPAGRPATAADSSRVIELLNSAHRHEELFVAYTEASVAARLERQPGLYSWQHLRLGERAVVGVWPAHINVIRETTAGVENDVRALVLDYGYEPGAEHELIALVRTACAELHESGTTELTLFTCPQSTAYAQLVALAKRLEPYVLSLRPPPAEPDDLATRGIYVDQLYF